MFLPCRTRRVTQQRLEVRGRRRGAIVPLTALLLVVLLGMLAFAIDLSYASEVESELQNVADAAALAGAGKLQELFVQYNSPGQTNQSQIVARDVAVRFLLNTPKTRPKNMETAPLAVESRRVVTEMVLGMPV